MVEKLLDNLIGFDKLEEFVCGKYNIVIISFDYMCLVFLYIIILILLWWLWLVVFDVWIWIFVVIGFYWLLIYEELVNKYGEDIVNNEEIVMYVLIDDSSMVKIG